MAVQSDDRLQQMAGSARGASATDDATTCQVTCVTCGGKLSVPGEQQTIKITLFMTSANVKL